MSEAGAPPIRPAAQSAKVAAIERAFGLPGSLLLLVVVGSG